MDLADIIIIIIVARLGMDYVMNHISLILFIFFVKSLLYISMSWKESNYLPFIRKIILCIIVIITDMLRTGSILFIFMDGLQKAFEGNLFNMLRVGIGLLCASIILILPSYMITNFINKELEFLIFGEILSLIILVIEYFLIYKIFEMW